MGHRLSTLKREHATTRRLMLVISIDPIGDNLGHAAGGISTPGWGLGWEGQLDMEDGRRRESRKHLVGGSVLVLIAL